MLPFRKKIVETVVLGVIAMVMVFAFTKAFAEDAVVGGDAGGGAVVVDNTVIQPVVVSPVPAKGQEVTVTDTTKDTEPTHVWKADALTTAGLKFLVRGKEALAWTINIRDAGFSNPAISSSFLKVLTIVNSVFILGLLAIALMWMFSILIPRTVLRQTVLIYGFAVVLVNFALPLNRLLVDSTNLLQKTFLTQNGQKIGILDIVETPSYDAATGFEEQSTFQPTSDKKQVNVELPNPQQLAEVPVGHVQGDPAKPLQLTGVVGGANGGAVQLFATDPTNDSLTLTQPLSVRLETVDKANPNQEQSVFVFVMIGLTGLAYFLLAMLFVLRIVILWALLILSPVLFVLAVFRSTRGYFYNWLAVYGRWLLMGPLAALGIAVVVNIWQVAGVPVTSAYTSTTNFGNLTNVVFRLPGSLVANTLSTPSEMMQYVIFLMMLYLPIFLAFALTRSKALAAMATNAVEIKASVARALAPAAPAAATGPQGKTGETGPKENANAEKSPLNGGLFSGVKDFLTSKVGKLTSTAMPANLREAPRPGIGQMPTASNFLPEALALTPLHDMMGLMGAKPGSRHGHEQAIEKLANPSSALSARDRENTLAVRDEVSRRAAAGDPEAANLMTEIESKAAAAPSGGGGLSAAGSGGMSTHTTNIEKNSTSKITEKLKEAHGISTVATENAPTEKEQKKAPPGTGGVWGGSKKGEVPAGEKEKQEKKEKEKENPPPESGGARGGKKNKQDNDKLTPDDENNR